MFSSDSIFGEQSKFVYRKLTNTELWQYQNVAV